MTMQDISKLENTCDRDVKKSSPKNSKMSAYKFKWEPIPNVVRRRMVDDSLLHTLRRNSRINRQKKILNMRIRTGEKIQSYEQYLKLKQKVTKKCPDNSAETDNDTSDDNSLRNNPNYRRSEKIHYLLTPCQQILKNGTQSLRRNRTLSDCKDYDDTDDDSDHDYKSTITRSKKTSRSAKRKREDVSSAEDHEHVRPNVKKEKDENENDSTTMNGIKTDSENENNNAETNEKYSRIQISEVRTLKSEDTSIGDNLQSNHDCTISNDILPTSAFKKKNKRLIQTALYNLGSNCDTVKTIKKESWHESTNCDEAVGKENVENNNEDAVSSNEYSSRKNNESGKIINPNLAEEDTSGSGYKKKSHRDSNKRVTNKQLYDSEELCTERQNLTRQEFSATENGDGTKSISEDGDKVSSSTSTATPRVSNLADYVVTQQLKLDMRKGTIKLKHISPDDEIWIMEVPKKIKPEDLLQQTLVLDGKTRLEVQDTCYKISAKRNRKDIHLSCMFNTGKRKKRFKTVNLKPEGFIKFRQKVSDTREPESVLSHTTPVQFPKNLKMRHPLLGSTYKNNSKNT